MLVLFRDKLNERWWVKEFISSLDQIDRGKWNSVFIFRLFFRCVIVTLYYRSEFSQSLWLVCISSLSYHHPTSFYYQQDILFLSNLVSAISKLFPKQNPNCLLKEREREERGGDRILNLRVQLLKKFLLKVVVWWKEIEMSE